MQAEQRIVDSMKALGFTASDAKAYVALIRSSPATGYEVAARSGVPRSAIYGVLKGLEARGVVALVEETPARYAPLDPERLAGIVRGRVEREVQSLTTALSELPRPAEAGSLWRVRGYDRILERAEELIDAAADGVFLSAWGREVDRLAPALRRAGERGVYTLLFSFSSTAKDVGDAYTYGLSEADLEEFWDHRIVLVVDGREVLMGGAEQTPGCTAVVTTEPDIVGIAEGQIALDLTLMGQRQGVEVSTAIVRMLGDRVGRLDTLLS